ncbi:hypothetical protein LCGC14_1614100, partial [marine sediment metagenome]
MLIPAAETIVDPITPFETVTSRGFNGLKWWGSPGPHPDVNNGTEVNQSGFIGARDPGAIKNAPIWRVSEYHITDGASGTQRVEFIVGGGFFGRTGNMATDFFKALTITDQADTVVYHNLLS